jgi:predicted aspartyl protease
MKKATFERQNDEQLIVIDCKMGSHKVLLALDTGASHTTIDLAALIIAGYSMTDAVRTVDIETASGIVTGHVFVLKKFIAIDTEITNVEVCAYDFFANHVLPDFDGVLGLDFFKNVKFCIDMNRSEITIQ